MIKDIQIIRDTFGEFSDLFPPTRVTFFKPVIFKSKILKLIRKKVSFKDYFCCQVRLFKSKIIKKLFLQARKAYVALVEPPECNVLFEWPLNRKNYLEKKFGVIGS